ncbi:TniQ family protein [Pseudomonas sp. E6002]|uniref:TniQ family protein n=1 Tax=Pseudomonas sp. E6002 TaxID=2738820 RepID=UPI0015A1BF51|nr:TniQ family protein [Pseudomonas sp. E6002]NWB40485.1 TniQ family protein [Pseudomonas sp. E6002]
MLLQIQPDESLISFVIRAIHINQYSSESSLLDDLSPRSVFDTKQLRKIAGLIGWPGCYGFNRLVHNHTLLAAKHVIKGDQDISYSGSLYASKAPCLNVLSSAYCPDCVREDLESRGFSYWRRYTYPNVTVCHKHNSVLLMASHDAGLIRTYEQHFINHPMGEVELSRGRAARKAERERASPRGTTVFTRVAVARKLCH